MKFKKIFKGEDRFIVSEEVFLYEIMIHQRDLPKRKLQPTFENRFWEVYALHRQDGLYYAVIGKHHDVRVFYKQNIIFSRSGRFYLPIGRDLATKAMGDIYWQIVSAKKGKLVDETANFFAYTSREMAYISNVRYVSPVVHIFVKTVRPLQGENDFYLKQGESGYKKIIKKEKVEQEILNAKNLPEDPWYV